MSTQDIRTTSDEIFQVGIDGVQLKSFGGVLYARNKDDNANARIKAAVPVEPDDVVIKSFVVDNIKSAILQWSIVGPTFEGSILDGFRIAPFDGYIEGVFVSLGERGNDGNTIVDVKKGNANLPTPGTVVFGVSQSTIWTTTSNRPTIAGDSLNKAQNAVLRAYLPDLTTITKGDLFSFDVVSRTASSRDLVVQIFIKKT